MDSNRTTLTLFKVLGMIVSPLFLIGILVEGLTAPDKPVMIAAIGVLGFIVVLGLIVVIAEWRFSRTYAYSGGKLFVQLDDPLSDSYSLSLNASLEELSSLNAFYIDVVRR